MCTLHFILHVMDINSGTPEIKIEKILNRIRKNTWKVLDSRMHKLPKLN